MQFCCTCKDECDRRVQINNCLKVETCIAFLLFAYLTKGKSLQRH